MANMKNAKKKIKQIAKKTEENVMLKSTVKNAIKNTDKAVLAGDKEAADKYLKAAIKEYEKRISKYSKLEIIELEDESNGDILSKEKDKILK